MSMFIIEKNIKSSEEKVVSRVIYCSLSDFVFFTFEVSLLSTPFHVRLRSLNFRYENV
jgi:arginine exporter protein ArgO